MPDFRNRLLLYPKIFGSFANQDTMDRLSKELQEQYPEAIQNSFYKTKSRGHQGVKSALLRFYRENKPKNKNLPVAFLIVTKHNRFRGSPHVGLGIKTYRENSPQCNESNHSNLNNFKLKNFLSLFTSVNYFSTDLYINEKLNPSECGFLDGTGGLRAQLNIKNRTRYLFGGQKDSADCLIRVLEFLSHLLDGTVIETFDWRDIKDYIDA